MKPAPINIKNKRASFDYEFIETYTAGNVHILYPKFATYEIAIRIHQARLAQTDGLDFRSRQHNACRVGFDEFIIKRSPLVLYINRCRFHQFNINDNLSKMTAITLGQIMMMTEAIKE